MSDYPDWQADNEPMRAALARLHHLHRMTGQVVPEAKEQFFAALQDAYFLVPRHDDGTDEEDNGGRIAFYFETLDDGLMLSVFSSVADARAFFGEDHQLNRIIQSTPDFFGSIINMAEILDANGNALAGVVLDRASENSYFFDIPELVALSAGGRVLGPAQQVSIENEQIQIVAMPENSPLSPPLVAAFQEVMGESNIDDVRELWAFWLTVDGKREHLGLAIASERPEVIGQMGSLLEEKWREVGPKYAAFDLIPLVGPQEAAIRAHGTVIWRYEPPKAKKRPFWRLLKP
ncbi:hypothetical protein IAD21_01942 [Abditibacteriota bacterium]|nr:hypothetical protein IAD21_01942 [Abditibacteriota bacterium]